MTEMMKAVQLLGPGESEYVEIPRPTCEPGGLLVQVDAVGLCGSDVRTYTHGHHNLSYPAILGHENAGTIVEVGAETRGDWQVGERVIINPIVPCGYCYYCHHDRPQLCAHVRLYGTELPGGYAEYMSIPTDGVNNGLLLRVPEDIPADEIILVETCSSVVSSQIQLRVGLGDVVVVIGSGPVGCLHAQVAKLNGATLVIQADINQARLEQAQGLGADVQVNSATQDLRAKVLELTDGLGADVVIVAAPATEAHQQGIDMLKAEGRLSIFGGVNKQQPWTQLEANTIHYKRLEVSGAYAFNFAEFELAYKLVTSGKINRDLITHRIPLSQLKEGLGYVASGEAIKVAMMPGLDRQ